jgi:hypothetical protein
MAGQHGPKRTVSDIVSGPQNRRRSPALYHKSPHEYGRYPGRSGRWSIVWTMLLMAAVGKAWNVRQQYASVATVCCGLG